MEKSYDNPRHHIKNQRHHFSNTGLYSQSYSFSSGHVWMWELEHQEGWAPKNWCFHTVVLEKTLESPLDSKEIKQVNPNGNQTWIIVGRTDDEVKVPILWPPDVKSQLIGKDSDAGKDWGYEEKGTTENEMVGWHHRLDGHGFGWTLGVGDGQGGLACCSSRDRKELDTTERLNWTELWNLEKWCRWSYLQNRNRVTDIEDKCMATKAASGLGDWNWHIYTIYTKYKIHN